MLHQAEANHLQCGEEVCACLARLHLRQEDGERLFLGELVDDLVARVALTLVKRHDVSELADPR